MGGGRNSRVAFGHWEFGGYLLGLSPRPHLVPLGGSPAVPQLISRLYTWSCCPAKGALSLLRLQLLPHDRGENSSEQPLLKRFIIPQATLCISSCDLILESAFSWLASIYNATVLPGCALNSDKGLQTERFSLFSFSNP